MRSMVQGQRKNEFQKFHWQKNRRGSIIIVVIGNRITNWATLMLPQEKISCSLVLKLKVFISKYLQEHYTLCITRAVLFFKNVPGTFFNARHQVKAIAIGVSEVNPLVEIDWLLWCVHQHVFFPLKSGSNLKGLLPYTYFYISLYSSFSDFMGITFNNITF